MTRFASNLAAAAALVISLALMAPAVTMPVSQSILANPIA